MDFSVNGPLRYMHQKGGAMIPEPIIKAIIDRVVSVADPIKIILFGSHVRGDAEESSDIDILVLKKQVISKHRESVELWRALKDVPFPKDILVASLEEFEYYRCQAGSVFRSASEEGVEIYAK